MCSLPGAHPDRVRSDRLPRGDLPVDPVSDHDRLCRLRTGVANAVPNRGLLGRFTAGRDDVDEIEVRSDTEMANLAHLQVGMALGQEHQGVRLPQYVEHAHYRAVDFQWRHVEVAENSRVYGEHIGGARRRKVAQKIVDSSGIARVQPHQLAVQIIARNRACEQRADRVPQFARAGRSKDRTCRRACHRDRRRVAWLQACVAFS